MLLVLTGAPPSLAQNGGGSRIDRLLSQSSFNRATWGIYVEDRSGRPIYTRNADRLFVPASNRKLALAAAALALLPPDHRIITSVYASGPIRDGVVLGDLVIYGRGDPTFSERCYGLDTVSTGACETLWSRIGALADSIAHRGVTHIAGNLVGDGSFFDPVLVHDAWDAYDLNWWYAAPVSALGFNDNSVNVTWGPGTGVGVPPPVEFEPVLDNFEFENRARTVARGQRRTIDFFRHPGTMKIWAEGSVPLGHPGKTEYFALPDPNLYFAQALRAALERRGIRVSGQTESTTDSLRYRSARAMPPLVEFASRPLPDRVFPILNSSQNLFAEMLVKLLGKTIRGDGSWEAGLAVERHFLIDSVGLDPSDFRLSDGSGLSSDNGFTPRALAEIVRFMLQHSQRETFVEALPRSGLPGSLRDRFVGTSLEGRVVAKTGSINGVTSLTGYIEQPDGNHLIFAIIANGHRVSYRRALGQIDAIVRELDR